MFKSFGWLWKWFSGGSTRAPARPQLGRARLSKEDSNVLIYEITMGQVAASSDVTERHMKTIVNGQEQGIVVLERNSVKIGGLRFNDGDKVRLELRDVDDAGNHSEPAVVEFVAADTIAPDVPTGFGVLLVAEIKAEPTPVNSHPLIAVESHRETEGKPGEGKAVVSIDTEELGTIDPDSARQKLSGDLKSVGDA